ncbi:DUF1878 family protein [Paenibacillus popilliae]|uniref:Uncharacterized protein n=1 Tax=Paenibacillus popilliae ATCC 14706 TaxID=1212764 RepID=M9M819_PAEPP|nr:DUF1878 family protein [Paenibacillus popilliae]GAC44013.1 hypothetical protein PPOP_3413 [Paenibacillus popilliae ATCC 14706]
MTNEETMKERIDRLEYYIHVLKNYISVDRERFLLWDWAVSQRLNEQEFNNITDYLKSIANKMEESDCEDDYPTIEQFVAKINNMVYQELRDSRKIIVDRIFFEGLFNGLIRIGKDKFDKLITYYSILKNR